MTLESGTKLGRYEIRSKIGAGGMGEVYLAEDTRLHRKVALKLLPADLASNQDRMRRFEQEAQAAAALNHPNIATVHEIGETNGVNFIAMEFIDGVTLRDQIHRERTELRKLLRYLQHVAEGLAKAHAAGIVHRDLKPDNIMITRDGHAKILDFGLAKLIEPKATVVDGADQGDAATAIMQQHSTPGVIMGTVGYMSPEQAQGKTKEIDQRSDIFSFGCILFEAATGKKPFEGDSIVKSLHNLIYEPTPQVKDLNPSSPVELQRIIRRCLAKDPEQRYQSIKEVAIELKELRRELETSAGSDTTVPPPDITEAARDTESGPAIAATSGTLRPTVSSAEYVIAGIKRHKVAVIVLALVIVIGASLGGYYLHARNSEVAIDSIAVLPFVNQNHDPDSDYVSDGVTESIINSLTQIPNLKVIARSSSFRYKGKEVDPLVIGKELGVRAVLMGRISQRGENLSISTELIDVRDNKQLWGEQYSEKMSDLLSVQREISGKITSSLRLKLSGEQRSRVTKNYTRDPEAYQLYLKGRYELNKRTEDSFKKGVEFFNRSIEQDPNYALAYAGLADAYNQIGMWAALPPRESFSKAKAAAEKALQLDGTLGEARTALAFEEFQHEWNFVGAESEYQHAINLNPSFSTTRELHGYQMYIANPRRFNDALQELKTAQELDPLSMPVSFNIAAIFYFERRYDEAIEQLKKIHDFDPDFTLGNGLLGAAYMRKGMSDEAITAWLAGSTLEGQGLNAQSRNILNEAYKKSGIKSYLQKHAELLEEESKRRYVSPYFIAIDYADLGKNDIAFAWLEKAFQERSSWLIEVRVDPVWDNLHSDQRYADLLRRIGLPQ